MFNKTIFPISVITFLSIIGVGIFILATPWGIGISFDSVKYIDTARNVSNGLGFSIVSQNGAVKPVTVFPPLFPTALSLIGIFGLDPVNGARWLGALLLGANLFLVGFVIHRRAPCYPWLAVFGGFLVLASPTMLKIHAMAWTEPLFIFFGLLGMFILTEYIYNPHLIKLVLCSLANAMACLTRYAGIPLIGTGIVAIWTLSTERYYKRLLDSAIFAFVSSLPLVLWIIRNLYVAGSATSGARKLVFHPLNLTYVRSAIETVSGWALPAGITPFSIKSVAALVIFLLPVIIIISALFRKKEKKNIERLFNPRFPVLAVTFSIFVILYELFLVISISFLDGDIPLNYRILSPVFISTAIIVVLVIATLYHELNNIKWIRSMFIALCIAFLSFNLFIGTNWLNRCYANGLGYSSKKWKTSETIQQIKKFPRGVPIFSNAPDAIYFLTGKHSSMLPNKYSPNTRQVNNNYQSDLTDMVEHIRKQDGVLVYFKNMGRSYLPSEEELAKQLSFRPLLNLNDGTIYTVFSKP